MYLPQATDLDVDAFRSKLCEQSKPLMDLHARVLDAFLSTPDALHGQALTVVEVMQAQSVEPSERRRDYLSEMVSRWRKRDPPGVVAEVRDALIIHLG